MRVLGVCGSLRRESFNRRLLVAAAKGMPDTVVFELFDRIAEIPPYNEDTEAGRTPAAVTALRGAIAGAHAVVIATPEYNASVPGVLKNAVDWASTPYPDSALRGKPVMVIGASVIDFGATLAQADLRRILKAIGAHVQEEELLVRHAHEVFSTDGELKDPQLGSKLASMVDTLVRVAPDCECA
jgi:chromate reductase, NAD(P)H dehydrogenase (quinone)